MNRSTVFHAFKKSWPVMAGYVVLGIGFGVLMHDNGFGPLLTFAMSFFVYTGTLQFVGVNLLAGSASVISTFITGLVLNARHLFYGISMYRYYKEAGRLKPYLIFTLTDETYSLLCDGDVPEGDDPHLYRALVSGFDRWYWIIGSVMGVLIGPNLPFDTTGIDFSMTALFTASFVSQWQAASSSKTSHAPALIGLAVSLISLIIFGADNFLIPAMLIIILLLSVMKISDKSKETLNDKGDQE